MSLGKQIQFGVEGIAAMLRGVNLLADAVQVSNTDSDTSLIFSVSICDRFVGDVGKMFVSLVLDRF